MAGVKEIKPEGFQEDPNNNVRHGIPMNHPGAMRKRNVVGQTGDGYILYEIPYESGAKFVAELDKNTANPVQTVKNLKWIWMPNYKGRSVGEWTGERAKTYTELTKMPDKYNIGKNYILSPFAVIGPKKLKAGQVFWLEAFSLTPELKSPVGVFAVLVTAKPLIITVDANKPLSKCGCDIDKPNEYRYGELLSVKVLVHGIRGHQKMRIDIKTSDSKITLVSKIVTNLEQEKEEGNNSFIGVYYNFTTQVDFILDNKWKDRLDHQKGQTKELIAHVGIWENLEEEKPINIESWRLAVPTSSSAKTVKPKPVEVSNYSSEEIIVYWDTDEVANSRQQQSAQLVKIGTGLVKTICHDPCKYEKITIEDTAPDAKAAAAKEGKTEYKSRKFVILAEEAADGKKVLKDRTYMTFNLVAGYGKGQREVLVHLDEVVINDDVCHNLPKHTGKVFDTSKIEEAMELDKKPEEETNSFLSMIMKGKTKVSSMGMSGSTVNTGVDVKPAISLVAGNTDTDFRFRLSYPYGNMANPLRVFSYFNVGAARPHIYTLLVQSCRYQRPVSFAVYPDLKWAINFSFNFAKIGWFENKKWFKESKYKLQSMSIVEETININAPEFQLRGVRTSLNMNIQANDTSMQRGTVSAADSKKLKPGKKIMGALDKMELGLEAQWNGGDQKVDLKEEFFKDLYAKFKLGFDVYKEVAKLIKGEGTPRENLNWEEENLFTKFLNAAKKERKKLTFELIPPSIAASLGWSLEAQNDSSDDSLNNLNSVVYDFAFDFSPIFGASVTLDLLALVQNAHPIAYVVVKLVDIGATMSGAELIAELKLSGEIGLKGEGRKNVMKGVNTYGDKQYLKDTEKVPLEGNAKIELSLTLKFTKNKTYNLYIYKVIVNAEVSAEAKTFVQITAAIMVDDGGIHVAWEFVFGGLLIDLVAKVTLKGQSRGQRRDVIPDPNGPKAEEASLFNFGGKSAFVLIKESKYPMGKWYFNKPPASN